MADFPLGPEAAPGFDDPLGMLYACHRRMERQLASLGRLRRHLPEHHADTDARVAARAILRYFDMAAPNHHDDEEASLFPRLAAAAPQIARSTALLQREHRHLDAHWMKLRPLLAAIATGNGAFLPTKGVTEFCDAYLRHLQREEEDLLPVAAELLDAAALAAIGAEMAQRRNAGGA
jgi:hemerythrin-like domain-containing protein